MAQRQDLSIGLEDEVAALRRGHDHPSSSQPGNWSRQRLAEMKCRAALREIDPDFVDLLEHARRVTSRSDGSSARVEENATHIVITVTVPK